MFKKVTIQADQRGLLFHKGSYVKKLMPGTYHFLSWSQPSVAVLNTAKLMDENQTLFRLKELVRKRQRVNNVRDLRFHT
ncbi:hypothetical protein ACFFK0_15840 [Paenibacillus chartarius]|uniref:Uncharacterized protein n=1 Tax=Paenibacillus chartarius TaxID=747481 RepID=A0ABV6DMS4_9BACL